MPSKALNLAILSVIFLFSSVLELGLSVPVSKVHTPQWKGTVETEEGIRVVKNPNTPLFKEIVLDLERDLSLGRQDDENTAFFRPRDLEVDGQGNIYIADMSNNRIQKFDKNGKYLMTIGKQGQGPGEFEQPARVRVESMSGAIYVKDQAYTIEIFDRQGIFKKSLKADHVVHEFQVDRNGKIWPILIKSTPEKSLHILCRYNDDGIQEGTFAEFPYTWIIKRQGEVTMVSTTGQELAIHLAKIDDASFVYGYSGKYLLTVIDLEGKVLFKIQKEEGLPKFTDKEKGRFQKLGLPEQKPYFYAIFTDDQGRIYVQRNKTWAEEEDIKKELDVFSREGYFLFKTTMPRNTMVIRNGYLYAFKISGEDEIAERYRIKNWGQLPAGDR